MSFAVSIKEGFARVKCDDCGEEMFVAFSCRQRSCCLSCGEKRDFLLGHCLTTEVLAPGGSDAVICRILIHCGLLKDPPVRPPPMPATTGMSNTPITEETIDEIPDYSFFDIYDED